MEFLNAIGRWITQSESLLSGAAALIVLLGVVASGVNYVYRRMSVARDAGAAGQSLAAPTAQQQPHAPAFASPTAQGAPITLKSLSAPAPYAVRFAESDGLRIAYAVQGSGPHDIVMAPGMISHLNIMSHLPPIRDTLNALSAFARVLCFDKRGQGLSDPSVQVPDLDQRVHDIEAVMDAAGMDKAILFGVSEGGPMCLKFAHDHPGRVLGLVLLGTTARWLQSEDFPTGIAERVLDSIPEAWGTSVLRQVFFPSITREQMDDESYRGMERLIATRQSVRQLVDYMKKTDVRPLLPLIQCPALVVHFAGDLALPLRLGRALAAALPNAEFLEVGGIDHADLSQSPQAVERVRRFVESHAPHSPRESQLGKSRSP
jgi:pimeloyl-ACP methyl ester carboxylesterase